MSNLQSGIGTVHITYTGLICRYTLEEEPVLKHQEPLVAYFCMEYGLHEELPLYAGGLGILAGDVLKSAKDLNKPMVGIGILWSEGYTAQYTNADGWPEDHFSTWDYHNKLKDTGVVVHVNIRGENVPIKVWVTDTYGNVPLYLLDTNLPDSPHAWITRQLYGGSAQDRVAQEMVLGIGGVRALRALGIPVDIYHFNEGHAVFAGIELIREKMKQGASFADAWRETIKQCVFTTHTPVRAGNESHDHGLLQYMGAYNGLDYEMMRAIGGDPFAMTVAGLRLSFVANGVAKMHGKTARSMWDDICNAAPIIDITNGVHPGTWQDPEIRKAYETGTDLWEPHMRAKSRLVKVIKERTGVTLNENNLIIGFARRAATYKRSNLIFHRPDIIDPLLQSGQVQLVFAGKAHPQDEMGKQVIYTLVQASRRYPNSVVFLDNYDMELGKLLTAGSDVWLNNPKRPLEASGTSGMKAAMNGVLNFSTLDGWWPEGCIHGVNGWQIGGGYEGPGQTEHDVMALYEVLLEEIVPTYYENRAKWTDMMRASIDMSIRQFSSLRMVQEYYNLMYVPQATNNRIHSQQALLTRPI